MAEEEGKFAESIDYQIKVLALMLSNPQFCDIAGDALDPSQFGNRALVWYYNTLASAAPQLTSVTLKEELLRAARSNAIKEDEVSKYVELFKFVSTPPVPAEVDHIQKTMGTFIRTQSVKKTLIESFDLIEREEWDQIASLVTDATQKGVDILSLGQDYFKEYQDRLARRLDQDEIRKVATGIPALDELLYGGIKNKQLGLIAGGTGRGKSVFLQWLARVALLLGKNVVYFTHELAEDDVAERFDSMFSRVRPAELVSSNTEVFTALAGMSARYSGKLMIKEWPADECTVPMLKTYLMQLTSINVMPDLVIVDYLDLLKPHRTYNDTYQELDSITKALHGLAKSMNTRIWTATQLNRSGLQAETPDESSMAGSLAKLFTVDISIFMAQTKEEREDETMRLWLAKSRNGPAGRIVEIDTDYSFMTFYKDRPEVAPSPGGDDGAGQEESSETEEDELSASEDMLVL